MRVIIILAAIAFTHGAKLEKTYLPPSNARTAGGSGNFLQAPGSGVSGSARNYQTPFSQSNDYSGNNYAQSGNNYVQSGNDYPQSGNNYAQSGNAQNGEYNNVNYNFGGRPERPRAALERNAAILRQDNSNDGETYSYAYETENGIYAEESGVATNGVEAQGGFSYTGDDGQIYSIRYTADQNGFVPQGDHLPTPPPVPEEILKALEQNARDEAAGIYDDGSYNEGKYSGADGSSYNYQQNNAYNGNNDDAIVTNSALARSSNAAYSGPTYIAPSANAVAPTYGAPNAPSFNSAKPIAPTYGAPNAPFNAASNRNAPSFTTATASIAPAYNAPNAGIRNSAAEKAYLPPFADQRGQAKNSFGGRQQSFDARTGYNY